MARCGSCHGEFEAARQDACPLCGAPRPRPNIPARPAPWAAPPAPDAAEPVHGVQQVEAYPPPQGPVSFVATPAGAPQPLAWAQPHAWPPAAETAKRGPRPLTIFLVLMGTALALGLGAVALFGSASPFGGGGSKTITSSDGAIALTVPGGWAESPGLNPNQSLGAANIFQERYVVVIDNPKNILPPGLTLQQASDIGRTTINDAIENEQIVAASAPGAVIAGKPAIETIITGQMQLAGAMREIAYIHTVLDFGDRYLEVLAWTLGERLEDNREALREVVASVRTQAPSAAA